MTSNEEIELRVTERRGARIIEVLRHESLAVDPFEPARAPILGAMQHAPAPRVFKFLLVAPAQMSQHALEEMTFSA